MSDRRAEGEFRIARTEFLRRLRLAQGIADRKSTMPMLANLLLRTQGKSQLLVDGPGAVDLLRPSGGKPVSRTGGHECPR